MAYFHSRSNSFPSQSHPIINDVECHLDMLKASHATSTSSICANLASLRDLHDGINNMIRMPSIQQAISHEQGEDWVNELLEGSLKLVDLCAFSRDIVQLTKESIQELESSIRRKADDLNAYLSSRKKINKMFSKCIKTSKGSNKSSSALPTIGKMLKEAELLVSMIIKSILILLTGEKEKSNQRSWSLFSKSEVKQESRDDDLSALNIHKSPKGVDGKNTLKQLKTSIQEIEEGLRHVHYLWN